MQKGIHPRRVLKPLGKVRYLSRFSKASGSIVSSSIVDMTDRTGHSKEFQLQITIIRNYLKENYRFYLVVPDYNCQQDLERKAHNIFFLANVDYRRHCTILTISQVQDSFESFCKQVLEQSFISWKITNRYHVGNFSECLANIFRKSLKYEIETFVRFGKS